MDDVWTLADNCNCDLCKQNRQFDYYISNVDGDTAEYFKTLYEKLMNVEFDLDYANAIIDGSWPSADEVIAFNRKKIKESKNEV